MSPRRNSQAGPGAPHTGPRAHRRLVPSRRASVPTPLPTTRRHGNFPTELCGNVLSASSAANLAPLPSTPLRKSSKKTDFLTSGRCLNPCPPTASGAQHGAQAHVAAGSRNRAQCTASWPQPPPCQPCPGRPCPQALDGPEADSPRTQARPLSPSPACAPHTPMPTLSLFLGRKAQNRLLTSLSALPWDAVRPSFWGSPPPPPDRAALGVRSPLRGPLPGAMPDSWHLKRQDVGPGRPTAVLTRTCPPGPAASIALTHPGHRDPPLSSPRVPALYTAPACGERRTRLPA